MLLTVGAIGISAGWLFRDSLLREVKPQLARAREVLTDHDTGRADPDALRRAEDRIDSLHGWSLDSISLTRSELAALVLDGLPEDAVSHLDSLEVLPGSARLTVRARLDLSRISPAMLGPLSGALEPSEWATFAGPIDVERPGRARWRIEALALREVTFPVETSRRLVSAALPLAEGANVALKLPDGVVRLELRASGAMVFRREAR